MTLWKDRPIEAQNLFNPSFCSLLLREAIDGYCKDGSSAMPYALSFLILPIVLHKSTREKLPLTVATKLHAWLQKHSEAKVMFANRAKTMVPYTKEAITFGIQNNIFQLTNEGGLRIVRRRLKRHNWPVESEPEVCIGKSSFVGKWLHRSGEPTTIFVMWGIQP